MKPTTFINRLVATPATLAASDRYDRNVEGKIQGVFRQWLENHGVFVISSRMDKRPTTPAGTPDFIFVYRMRPFAIELKRPGKKPSEKQDERLKKMHGNGWLTGWFDSSADAINFVKITTSSP